MKLSEFITESIVEILQGVQGAQAYGFGNAEVNPRVDASRTAGSGGQLLVADGEAGTDDVLVQMLEFDVSVTAGESETDTSGRGAGDGIGISMVNIRFNGEKSREAGKTSESVHRLKFSVPIALPHKRREHRPKPAAVRSA